LQLFGQERLTRAKNLIFRKPNRFSIKECIDLSNKFKLWPVTARLQAAEQEGTPDRGPTGIIQMYDCVAIKKKDLENKIFQLLIFERTKGLADKASSIILISRLLELVCSRV